MEDEVGCSTSDAMYTTLVWISDLSSPMEDEVGCSTSDAMYTTLVWISDLSSPMEDEVGCSTFDALPFGACEDPVRYAVCGEMQSYFFSFMLMDIDLKTKGQGQIWPSIYKILWAQYRPQFFPDHFQILHILSRGCWEEEPYWFGVTGQRSRSEFKVKVGSLSIESCGYDTDYCNSQITFTLHKMWIRGGALLILGYKVTC